MYNAPIKEIKFLLKDLFQIEKLFKDTKYESLDEDTLDGILDEVRKLSEKLISPINRDADTKPACLKNKKVILMQCNTNYTGSIENFRFIMLYIHH